MGGGDQAQGGLGRGGLQGDGGAAQVVSGKRGQAGLQVVHLGEGGQQRRVGTVFSPIIGGDVGVIRIIRVEQVCPGRNLEALVQAVVAGGIARLKGLGLGAAGQQAALGAEAGKDGASGGPLDRQPIHQMPDLGLRRTK